MIVLRRLFPTLDAERTPTVSVRCLHDLITGAHLPSLWLQCRLKSFEDMVTRTRVIGGVSASLCLSACTGTSSPRYRALQSTDTSLFQFPSVC